MPRRVPPTVSIYQVKVTLKGSKPPIWRRLLVPSTTRLGKFHEMLQVASPTHPEHESMLEWIGGEFNPEEFDLSVVNRVLTTLR